jgi:3-dehydroquinate dehydratase type I
MLLSEINKETNKKPRVCASIGNVEISKVISVMEDAANNNFSCVEIRFDLLIDLQEELLFSKYLPEIISCSERFNLPVIATRRDICNTDDMNNLNGININKEAKNDCKNYTANIENINKNTAEYKLAATNKLSFLKKLIDNGIKTVDIEQDMIEPYLIAEFIEFAHSKNSEVILSVHDFNSFINLKKAMQFYIEASYMKTDFFKMAAIIASKQEVLDILSICNKINELRNSDIENYPEFIIFGMGDEGKLTRILSLNYGSFLSYCSINDGLPTAPGQVDINTFNRIYESCNSVMQQRQQ